MSETVSILFYLTTSPQHYIYQTFTLPRHHRCFTVNSITTNLCLYLFSSQAFPRPALFPVVITHIYMCLRVLITLVITMILLAGPIEGVYDPQYVAYINHNPKAVVLKQQSYLGPPSETNPQPKPEYVLPKLFGPLALDSNHT